MPDQLERDRLIRTYRFLRANPGRHRQGGWYGTGSCGTWGCLAGHGVAMTPGWRVAVAGNAYYIPVSPQGVAMNWPLAGRIVFGLTPAQGARLFAPSNTIGGLRVALMGILGEDPEDAALPEDVEPETRTDEEVAAWPAQTLSPAPDWLTVPERQASRELVSTAA